MAWCWWTENIIFKYADGTRYYPMGTTAYAWTHMKETTQEATLKSFGEAGFNKVRMCVFPKNYSLVKDEPALYPFEMEKTIKDKEGNERKEWDFDRFDPAFFSAFGETDRPTEPFGD